MTDRPPQDDEARLARDVFGIEPATEDELVAARASGLLGPEAADEDEEARDEDETLDAFLGQRMPRSGEWTDL